jgi:AraC-like DNA-binding protein
MASVRELPSRTGHELTIGVSDADVLVTASYGEDPGALETIVGGATLTQDAQPSAELALTASTVETVVAPGTTKTWATLGPAETPRRLVIQGGFVVDDGRSRRLQQRARDLGYADLRGYRRARCDAGYSVPALAGELAVSEWTVSQALATQRITLPSRPQQLARQRRRFAQQRIATLVADLGFADIRAYLQDRLIRQEWLLADIAAELGAHRATVRRLMQQAGVRRVRRTARQVVAGERGRQVQSVSWQARRAARLEELGFADLGGYLQRRYLEQRWPINRMRAELGVGRGWLVAEMARLGVR